MGQEVRLQHGNFAVTVKAPENRLRLASGGSAYFVAKESLPLRFNVIRGSTEIEALNFLLTQRTGHSLQWGGDGAVPFPLSPQNGILILEFI